MSKASKAAKNATRHSTEVGFTGDGRNMALAGRVKRNSTGWRYGDRGRIHPNTADLTYCDQRAPGGVGTFLPDPAPVIPEWLKGAEMAS